MDSSGKNHPARVRDSSVSQFKQWCKPPLSRYPGIYQVQTQFEPGVSYQEGRVYTIEFIPTSAHTKDRFKRPSSQDPPSAARSQTLKSARLVKEHCLANRPRLKLISLRIDRMHEQLSQKM